MSTFARYRFPGGPKAATRWTARTGNVPAGCEALILLTIEELAVNELREPCHHWVQTVAFPVRAGELGEPLPHVAARELPPATREGDRGRAEELWDEVQGAAKAFVARRRSELSSTLSSRLAQAQGVVAEREGQFFDTMVQEIDKERDRVGAQVRRDIERMQKELQKPQQQLFKQRQEELRRLLADEEAELERRRAHYSERRRLLVQDRDRLLKKVLPLRYTLREGARVYPIAVEIRLAGGAP